jgi:endonuclease/exonuclease/phosphatase family metal-dependent hydrolase
MIKVMSFNIRYGLANDGENHWHKRKSLALARIEAFVPDLLGLQECRDDEQADFIRAGLPGYHFFGVHREGPGDTAQEMAPLLFRRKSFQLVESGCFWLSETPEIPGSMSWGSAYPRTVSWARLSCNDTGGEFLYMNTHFDYEPAAIDGDARCLRRWIEQLNPQLPLIITGDFNADKHSDAFGILTVKKDLFDAFRRLRPQEEDQSTFHAFGRPEHMMPIDWILISGHFKVLAAQIDRTHQGNLYPSDHYPITAVLDWEK